MTSIKQDEAIKGFQIRVGEIVKNLQTLTNLIGNEELSQTVGDLQQRILDPYMFVIVGEVKAGKSSFINALLATGEEICKVAPSPMTDTIQQIVYGDKEDIVNINPYLKRIYQPVDILKEISIVDTPGTNTIIDHHQEITERFIPVSDLIVFVFEAKNPYRQSAWDFFKYIHKDWHKKIIFVLQQKDLMNENDLSVNINGVKEFAVKNGVEKPLVFALSAKLEQEGNLAESGFLPLRKYIEENITGGKAPALKLQSNLQSSWNIHERIETGLTDRKKQWEADKAFRTDIRSTLDEQESRSQKMVDALVENLVAGYERITNAKEKELAAGLGFGSLISRSFKAIFNKEASAKNWLENITKDLESGLKNEMSSKLSLGVNDIAESIQQMAKIIDLKTRSSSTILKNDHELFSDIAEKRANVLSELRSTFERFLERNESFMDPSLLPEGNKVTPNIAAGGGIAIIGALLTYLTNVAVLDVTGGILTAVGLVFAGVTIGWNRRKILNGFSEEIEKGKSNLKAEVKGKLTTYVAHIKEKIDANFNKFDQLLLSEEKEITNMEIQLTNIAKDLETIKSESEAMLE